MLGIKSSKYLKSILNNFPTNFGGKIIDIVTCGKFGGSDGLGQRIKRLLAYLGEKPEDVYKNVLSAWPNPMDLLDLEFKDQLGPSPEKFHKLSWAEQMMACDQTNYLVDDILTKVDLASMSTSLEARVPLLDHRIVEWSWALPFKSKTSGHFDQGKKIMRNVLYNYVPPKLVNAPKRGFSMPLGNWLRSSLRTWVEDIISPARLKKVGYINVNSVKDIWSRHLRGENHTNALWTVLMFMLWNDNKNKSNIR